MTRLSPDGSACVAFEIYSLAPYGNNFPPTTLEFLQSVRSGALRAISPTGNPEDTLIGRTYQAMLQDFTLRLADVFESGSGLGPPDALIEVPSTRPYNRPYADEFRRRFSETLDLTPNVHRAGQFKSGEGASFQEVFTDTSVTGTPPLANIRSLLLIDDVLAEGKTVAAVVARLREAGLPEETRILVAVPLVVFA